METSDLNEFPCAFNLVGAERTTVTRLRDIQHNLHTDLDVGSSEAEQIRNKNLLTWIYFRLGKEDEAMNWNREVVEATKMKNIASLGNRIFIMLDTGDKQQAEKCLKYLQKMAGEQNFCQLLLEAKAEQAYYYSRLGGANNLKLAIQLFSKVVLEKPDNYLWKFGLGLVYRRATHANIVCSSPVRMDVEGYTEKAAEYLFEVAENADKRLSVMAYSQLANLRNNDRHCLERKQNAAIKNLSITELCRTALGNGYEMSFVLIQCGKVIRKSNVDESIWLLEKSLKLKKNSTLYHYLGVSYKKKASKTKDVALLRKAEQCFEIAIEIAKENFQAILDQGVLLKENGRIQEALEQIDKVTSSHLAATSNRDTVIRAYLEAGDCYLQLSSAAATSNNYEEIGDRKLTTAIGLAADIVLIMADFKNNAQKIWIDIRKILRASTHEAPFSSKQNEIYGGRLEILQTLHRYRDAELDDLHTVTAALNSYIQEQKSEHAITFLALVAVRHAISDSNWWTTSPMRDLKAKVLVQAISGRLRDSSENPTVLFQKLFKLFYNVCFGLGEQEDDRTCSTGHLVGDILVVYKSDKASTSTMKSARCLKEISISLFGLETVENLKGSGYFGDFLADRQLQEMWKFKVVILVLDNEIGHGEFGEMLKALPGSKELMNPPRIVIIDAGLKDGMIPACLQQYECLKLEDVGGLGDIEQCFEGGDQLRVVDLVKHVFHEDVDVILKLFYFILGQQWPCP